MDRFKNRAEAGKKLALLLTPYANRREVIVLALPRGGVPVAYQIAELLAVPLYVLVVRKLGVPNHKELAMGAIASGGALVFNDNILDEYAISKTAIQEVIHQEEQELQRRELAYREQQHFPSLADKIIILVDDGIATGATIKAAIQALRQSKPKSIVVAVPVAASDSCLAIGLLVDRLFCILQPEPFFAVGQVYDDFSETTDAEVNRLLSKYMRSRYRQG